MRRLISWSRKTRTPILAVQLMNLTSGRNHLDGLQGGKTVYFPRKAVDEEEKCGCPRWSPIPCFLKMPPEYLGDGGCIYQTSLAIIAETYARQFTSHKCCSVEDFVLPLQKQCCELLDGRTPASLCNLGSGRRDRTRSTGSISIRCAMTSSRHWGKKKIFVDFSLSLFGWLVRRSGKLSMG